MKRNPLILWGLPGEQYICHVDLFVMLKLPAPGPMIARPLVLGRLGGVVQVILPLPAGTRMVSPSFAKLMQAETSTVAGLAADHIGLAPEQIALQVPVQTTSTAIVSPAVRIVLSPKTVQRDRRRLQRPRLTAKSSADCGPVLFFSQTVAPDNSSM